MGGLTAVCLDCGRPYFLAEGHACTSPAGASATGGRALVPAASLPDGTAHPGPFLAERGWIVIGGIYRRATGPGDGEEAVA
jgi:hypothetical protein